ncbi:MAG TPA: site-specific DNA-methyltransferase, partial [Bacteroidetes bacterium]|nr:site-specific DNA-methyltransferase [Bacteroidota bacterium]
MSNKKTKLELTWIGKENRPRLEPRILVEDAAKSLHAPFRVGKDDLFDNRLIFGDNLLALKALEQEFAGKVKCIFIDPPYNTGSAFDHYDDGLEHSLWLSLMRDRLVLLGRMLRDDGSIWITIDDNEAHYLKVLCDEILGRKNFVASLCWRKIHSLKNDARIISVNHDTVLLYAKNVDMLKLNLLPRTETMNSRYSNPDNDPRGPWQSGDLVANEHRVNGNYTVKGPTGESFTVPSHKHWVYSQVNMEELVKDNKIWFGKDGTAFPRKKRFLFEVQQGRTPDTWWTSDDCGHNQEAKREIQFFNSQDIFATPKPERLLHRVLTLATNPGDLVLDSFAGSGTAMHAVMDLNKEDGGNRKCILIQMAEATEAEPKKNICKDITRERVKRAIDKYGYD